MHSRQIADRIMRALTSSNVSLLLFMLLVASSGQVSAATDVHVMQPWSRALPAVSRNGAAYVTLMNHGASAIRLVGASTPIADSAELHTHVIEEGVMKMRRLDGLTIETGDSAVLEPGGNHIMLFGLNQPLVEAEHYPLTLEFEDGAEVNVTVEIRAAHAESHAGSEHNHDDHGSGDDAHGHDRQAMENVSAAEAPTLSITVSVTAAGRHMLELVISNFEFSREHADDPHRDGEGHAHLYLNDVKLGTLYETRLLLEPLPPGHHQVRVGLYTNDHRVYAIDQVPIQAVQHVSVSD